MKKDFLHRSEKTLNISKKRFFTGVVIGLMYAFSFYSFTWVMREASRVFSITPHYDLWILTDEEMNFYNLFFAFISVIFGQAVCINYWLDRPRRIFSKQNYRIKNVINDQRNLNWFFLSWFSKLAFVFVIFFGLAYAYGFYSFSFYPDYKYLFVLIVIVLFFQSWVGLRLTFKRQSKKWLLVSIIVVSFFSFGLSRINVTDYKSFTSSVLSKSVHSNYNLILPESNLGNKLARRSLSDDIYLVLPKENFANTTPTYLMHNAEYSLNELKVKIIESRSRVNDAEINQYYCRLYIHRDIPMKYVNQFKSALGKIGVYKIAFATVPINAEYNQKYYINHSIDYRIPGALFFTPEENYKRLSFIKTIVELKQTSANTFTLNSHQVSKENLKSELKTLISTEPNHVLKYYVKDNSSYDSYIFCLTSIFESVYELRDDYAKTYFHEEEGWKYSEHSREIIKKFPLRIFEMTEEMVEQFE